MIQLFPIVTLAAKLGPVTPDIGLSSADDGERLYVQPRVEAGGVFTCPFVPGAIDSVCSKNWSGYVVAGSGGSFYGVSGSWVVPSVACPRAGRTFVATWVGIDGYSDGTVEQTGVIGQCVNGVARYFAWYEFYPGPLFIVNSVRASPGDLVSANVTYDGATDRFVVSIGSGGSFFSTSRPAPGADRSSAEWVVERPEQCSTSCKPSTLANFDNVTLRSAFTWTRDTNNPRVGPVAGTIGSHAYVAVTMVQTDSGPVLSEPSPLTSDGSSFTVLYAPKSDASPNMSLNPSVNSSTSISCIRLRMPFSRDARCSATVTGDSPTGAVAWSSAGPGTFLPSSCMLSGGTCSVEYVPMMTDTLASINAAYQGDDKNLPSAGNFSMYVSQSWDWQPQ